MFSKNLSIPVFLFISTLYLKLGNKRKMIAVSTQISWTEIGAERFLSAIFLIIFEQERQISYPAGIFRMLHRFAQPLYRRDYRTGPDCGRFFWQP